VAGLILGCGTNKTRSFDNVIKEISTEDLGFWLFLGIRCVFLRQNWRKNCANQAKKLL
jgi:hypothetical protein